MNDRHLTLTRYVGLRLVAGGFSMTNQASPSRRPTGISVLAVLCAVFGLQSLATAVQLFPLWLAAAKQHRYASMSFTWVALLGAVSGLVAAYALWRGRKWGRIPFVVSATLAVVSVGLITMFAVGEGSGVWACIVAGLFFAVVIAVAGWLVGYVWRAT